MKSGILSAFLLLILASASLVQANVVFEDNFDAEPGAGSGASGLSEINYTGFTQWSISNGSVDLVHQGDFGPIDCFGGSGNCVDLDGTTNDAGVMTSIGIALDPGLYRLDLYLAGTSNNFALDPPASNANNVNVSLASFIDTTIELAQGDPFTLVSELFTVQGPGGVFEIVISHEGGDNFGAILDNVSITAVPVPGAMWLLGSAAVLLRRRVLLPPAISAARCPSPLH